MKTRLFTIGLLMSVTLSLSARTFEKGERIYFNATPSSADWWKDGTYEHTTRLWGRLVNSGSEYWLNVDWSDGNTCYLEMPDDAFLTSRNWTRLVLYRCEYNNRNNVYDKTGEIDIDADYALNKNYIYNFYYGDYQASADWQSITSSPSGSPVGASKVDNVSKEVINACISSVGDPLSLQPVLAGDPLIYDYDRSAAHAWFKWNGSSWVALDGQQTGKHSNVNAWGYEGGAELHETIGAANSHTYYFLWTENPNHRRFIEVAVTKDCAATSKITDFGAVTSSVNAHDSTYVLDGIVAFESANGHTLRISVTDAKGEHHVDYVDPTTPLVFSLDSLFADGSTGVIATAEFLGTTYSSTTTFKAPDAVTGITTHKFTIAQKETKKLEPSTDGSGGYEWNDPSITEHDPIIGPFSFDTTVIYTYYEYETPPAVGGNLIDNGDFSTTKTDFYGTVNRTNNFTGSAISEYNFWGKDVTEASNFYDIYKHKEGETKTSLYGGFSIVKNANKFWKRYTKKIPAKAGTHFALFDADSTGSKKAWTVTTTKCPKLTLAKGTNYMFSFWVANINNYGEMNNAAKLQFAIRYKQGGSWSAEEKLGNPTDLNKYPDNIWHQNSYVFNSPVDASEVEIMVRDLNATKNPGGNDFALDDIQFRPISVVSQAIKNCERFVVDIYEPPTVVNTPAITITKTPACGKTDFSMDVTVSYSTLNDKFPITLELTDDIYGTILTTPIDPAVNPNSITLTLSSATYTMLVADGKVHTLTAKIIRKDGKGVDKGGQNSSTYTSPGIPTILEPVLKVKNTNCDKVTFDLEVTTEYLAFKGSKLHYEWDGTEWTNADKPDLSYKENTWQKAIGTLHNLPADGQAHTLRVYSDNAALDCDYTFADWTAPYSPQVTVVPTATILDFKCDDEKYQVKVETNFTNGQGHNLIFEDWNGDKKTVTTAAADTYKDCTFEYAWENPMAHSFKVYFEGAEDCKDNHVISFTSPFLPVIDNITVTGMPTSIACDAKDYTIGVNFTSLYTPIPAGKQIVITYDSLCNTKTTEPIDVTAFPYNLTLYNTATGTENTIYIAFADAPDCKKDYSYFPPVRETCIRDSVTICEGESYTWRNNKDYTGPVGENQFADGTDSLYLFVKEIPTITVGTIAMTCDDANVVRVPFSVVKGQPDSIGVAIGDSHLTATLDIVGTDTAFTFAPAAMKAGDYAAQVTVGTTGLSCTTEVDINFTIALSDYVYSKWTDVLFVSNKEGLFTTYQWFADGVAMTGETLQRLYDPNGLSGSSIVYHCRVTTTDGKTLYTCPQTFDDVTPSRTVDTTPANVKATTLYDSMGRVIKTTPHYGIYIVVEELENGEIRTRKITIHE